MTPPNERKGNMQTFERMIVHAAFELWGAPGWASPGELSTASMKIERALRAGIEFDPELVARYPGLGDQVDLPAGQVAVFIRAIEARGDGASPAPLFPAFVLEPAACRAVLKLIDAYLEGVTVVNRTAEDDAMSGWVMQAQAQLKRYDVPDVG